jgi:hypothetical protein
MYSPENVKEIRGTAALELMRYKAVNNISTKAESFLPFFLNDKDINEVLVAAGMPIITVDEAQQKIELDVIDINREDV